MNSILTKLVHDCSLRTLLERVLVGGNVLVKVGKKNVYYLLKYGHFHITREDYFRYHAHERKSFVMHGQVVFDRPTSQELAQDRLRAREAWWRYVLTMGHFGCLVFTWDEEFQIFIPSWQENNIVLVMATETLTNQVIPADITIETDQYAIENRLDEIMPPVKGVYPPRYPRYYNLVVRPFLNNEPTGFLLHGQNQERSSWSINRKKKKTYYNSLAWLESATKKMQHGDFLYIGSESFCMVLGVAINDDNRPYMQDRFIGSTNPILYWSIDECVYGLNVQPFVFPRIGRRQDVNHYPFCNLNTEVITNSLKQAIEHFLGTEHADGVQTLIQYAHAIDIIHPSAPKLEGKWYF